MKTRGCGRWMGLVFAIGAGVFGVAREARALEADELLLVVNSTQPEGRKLAERYAGARHVPEGRIVEVTVPWTADISMEQYDRDVVRVIRTFLNEHRLQSKVRCVVTFFGMPYRIARRPNPDEGEKREMANIQSELTVTRARAEGAVIELEKLAKGLDPTFGGTLTGPGSEDAVRRADAAMRAVDARLDAITDAKEKEEAGARAMKLLEELAGPNTVTLFLAKRDLRDPNLPAARREQWTKLVAFVEQAREKIRADLAASRTDSAARARAREAARQGFGLLEYGQVLQGQAELLRPGDTTAAVDSELALLWWDLYPRAAWLPNPLYVRNGQVPHPPVLMTCRLDGPTIAVIDRMMADSIRVEGTGLTGRVVVDTQGISAGRDAYAQFDKRLADLADIVKEKGKNVTLFMDVKKEVLGPGSTDNVALYAGWYSVQHYVPGFKMVPGAVAYHVASFEARSLQSLESGCWVPNLLNDGAAASLGAVAEPYLLAFPGPEEFFPLLMTGKLTLAEAYWKTVPSVSWMMTLVGDPLYNPFKAAPALAEEDLSPVCRAALRAPFDSVGEGSGTPEPTTRP